MSQVVGEDMVTGMGFIGLESGQVYQMGGRNSGAALRKDLEALAGRVTQLERGAAACIGIRRKCAEDGTPQSDTRWERWGQGVDATVEYARGDEEVPNDIMEMWPYNKIRPCNLPLASEDPVAYLGDVEFDWYGATGVAAGTNVMLEIPNEMYLARWYETDGSGQNWEYKCVADSGRYPNSVYIKDLMKRADGTKRDTFYFPIFLGSLDADGHYRSVAGVNPKYNYSCPSARTAVKTNGSNWQLIDVWAWEVMSDLLEIMSANANFRSTYGKGYSGFGSSFNIKSLKEETATNKVVVSNTFKEHLRVGMTVNVSNTGSWNASVCENRQITDIADSEIMENAIEVTLDGEAFDVAIDNVLWRGAQKTGATITMASPNGTSGANDGMHSVRTLWIEDFYGMLHTGVDGMNLKFNADDMTLEIYVCKEPSKYGDTYTGFELLPKTLELNAAGSDPYQKDGYTKKEHFFKDYPLLEMPDVVGEGAGSESYQAAYCWNNKNGQRSFFGGSFNAGSHVSPRSRNCDLGFGSSGWNYGSRPLRR